MNHPERDDARALALLAQKGRTATAFQVLAPGMSHWFDGDTGMVAYVVTRGAWVAAGEPVASREDAIGVAERFVTYADAHGKRVSFFATEGALASSPRFRRVLIGEQPVWNPLEWAGVIKANRSLREQLRRARAKGVRVRALSADDVAPGTKMRVRLDRLIQRWLATRPMSSMHFLVALEPFQFVESRRLFVAERSGASTGTNEFPIDSGANSEEVPDSTTTARSPQDPTTSIVAFLSVAPVSARNGWFLEHMFRDPTAPNGTSEALIDFAMRTLADEGVTWATLGLAPLAGDVSGWLRFARTIARPFYNFAGLSAFKRKLRPQSWEPIYLAYPHERSSVWAMRDGLRAFAGGSIMAFAARTVLRGPPPLLRALELSLVPWTIALALWPADPWFPSPVVKWTWVLFDVLLLATLYRLRTRWSDTLARRIAVVVTVDTVLTLAQTLLWNGTRTRSLLEVAMVVVACGGPALSAAVLWGAVRRRRILAP